MKGEIIMENEISIFENEAFGTVRTLYIEGQPWFVGKDVAEALGYSNPRDALSKHVDEDDKNTVAIRDGNKGNPNQIIINEAGVYSLIFSSKLPEAKSFKRWVTHEVLPSIRRHGVYLSDEALERAAREPEYLLELAREIKEEKDLFESLGYYNLRKELSNLSEELKCKRKNIPNILIEKGYLYHDKKKGLTPYPEYLENGMFETKTVTNDLGFRAELFSITPKGKEEIIRLIKET